MAETKPTDAVIPVADPVLDAEAAAPVAVPEAVELPEGAAAEVAGYAEPRGFISNSWDEA